MGTEVKLKREAIERRIAELEGKMPDIQASKEGAEARATIRRLKARLKTYPQEPKKRIYKVKARRPLPHTSGHWISKSKRLPT